MRTRRPTQREQILEYLEKRGSLTQLVAWSEMRVWRLAARIKELRERGHNIKTITRRDERGGRYAVYKLVQPTEEETKNEEQIRDPRRMSRMFEQGQRRGLRQRSKKMLHTQLQLFPDA